MISKNELKKYARQMAQKYGIDPELFVRQIQMESGFNPRAKSGAGAVGIAQFMPSTAKGMGFTAGVNPLRDLEMAAKLMAGHLRNNNGRYDLALAAYNAGQGNVNKHKGVPPFRETQNYVRNILGGNKTSNKKFKTKEVNALVTQYNNNPNSLQGQVSTSAGAPYDPTIGRVQGITAPDLYQSLTPQLRDIAIQTRTPFDIALEQMKNGLKTFEELQTQFPKEVNQFGITKAMEGQTVPQDILDRRAEIIGMVPTEADINQANQRVAEQNQQLVNAVNQREQGLRNFMAQQYAAQRADIANNPALQRGGYYLDPDQVAYSLMGDTALGLAYGRPDMIKGVEDAARARYQANIANQYGIPYDQLVAAQDAVYKNTVEAAKQNMQNAIIMYQRGEMNTADLMKAMQANQGAINSARNTALEQVVDYAKQVDPELIKRNTSLNEKILGTGADITRTGQVQAGGLQRNILDNQTDLMRTQYGTESELNQAEKELELQKQRQDASAAYMQQMADVAQQNAQTNTQYKEQMLPYQQYSAVTQGAAFGSTVPNFNAVQYGQDLGVIPQGNNYSLRSNPALQQNTGLFNILNRRRANEAMIQNQLQQGY